MEYNGTLSHSILAYSRSDIHNITNKVHYIVSYEKWEKNTNSAYGTENLVQLAQGIIEINECGNVLWFIDRWKLKV